MTPHTARPSRTSNTPPDLDALGIYLAQITTVDLLTPADELLLVRTYRAGVDARATLKTIGDAHPDAAPLHAQLAAGDAAYETLVTANLRLVVYEARRFSTALPLLDLIQEGNLGLMRGLTKFDPDRGCRIASFVVYDIRDMIGQYILRNERAIRVPRDTAQLQGRVQRTDAQLTAALGRPPTHAEIARTLGIAPSQVTHAVASRSHTISMAQPVGDDAGATIGDLVADEPRDAQAIEARALSTEIMRIFQLAGLTIGEQHALTYRFGLSGHPECSIEETAASMNIPERRAHRFLTHGLQKLRANQHGTGLAAYVMHA